MHDRDHNCRSGKSREFSQMEREMKRAAWRARRAARHAGRGDWAHLKDPKFWGLDAESMKAWGMGAGMNSGMNSGMGGATDSAEVVELKAQVAEMEKTIASMLQRIIVLEKLVVDDDVVLAREIEKLRDRKDPT